MTKDTQRKGNAKIHNYCDSISDDILKDLETKIEIELIRKEKYTVPTYSAKQLAKDINTNTRYLSATFNLRYGTNYSNYVNKLRVLKAKKLLVKEKGLSLTMEDISYMVGFSNRQSFYTAFYKFCLLYTSPSPRDS